MKLDEAEQAQRHTAEAQRYLGAAMTDAVSDLVVEGRSAAEVFENLTKSLAKAALQAALMGTGPLGGMFGTSAPQGGGAGGLFGSLISAVVGGGAGGSPTGGVRLFADGYIAKGPGTGRSDSIPAMISNGEAVIPAHVVSANRPLVEALVSDRLPKFADGRMPMGDLMASSLGMREDAMRAVPAVAEQSPAAPAINAPITIHMNGSSGDPAADRAHAEIVAKTLGAVVDQKIAARLNSAMRSGGALWNAGVRQAR